MLCVTKRLKEKRKIMFVITTSVVLIMYCEDGERGRENILVCCKDCVLPMCCSVEWHKVEENIDKSY